jgi:hypothetical protein
LKTEAGFRLVTRLARKDPCQVEPSFGDDEQGDLAPSVLLERRQLLCSGGLIPIFLDRPREVPRDRVESIVHFGCYSCSPSNYGRLLPRVQINDRQFHHRDERPREQRDPDAKQEFKPSHVSGFPERRQKPTLVAIC